MTLGRLCFAVSAVMTIWAESKEGDFGSLSPDIRSLTQQYWQLSFTDSLCQKEIYLEDDQMIILNSNQEFLNRSQIIRAKRNSSLVFLYSHYFALTGNCEFESLIISTNDTELTFCCRNKIPMVSGSYIEIKYRREYEDIHGFFVLIAVAISTRPKFSTSSSSPYFKGPNECGKTEEKILSRVIGGKDAKENAYPWMALVRVTENGNPIECGGSLISPDLVVTAAHCLDGEDLQIKVGLGMHDLSEKYESGSLWVSSESHYKHPGYDKRQIVNDLGLIKMERSVKYSSFIRPICLPTIQENWPPNSETVAATGWGLTKFKDDNSHANILQTVDLKVWENKRCKEAWSKFGFNFEVPSTQICAYENGKDTCLGDSGGPLTYLVENTSVLVGVTSYGYKCAERGIPARYTRIASYIAWIDSFLEDNHQSKE